MISINLKALTSAAAALALTVFTSWTFVDATSAAHLITSDGSAILAVMSALVG